MLLSLHSENPSIILCPEKSCKEQQHLLTPRAQLAEVILKWEGGRPHKNLSTSFEHFENEVDPVQLL